MGTNLSSVSGKSVRSPPPYFGPQMAQDRQGELGQVLERQDVELVPRQQIRRVQVISPEPAPLPIG